MLLERTFPSHLGYTALLSALQGFRHSLSQGSAGSRARTGASFCQKRTMLHPHFLAHHFLFLTIWSCFHPTFSSATFQGPSRDKSISSQRHSFAMLWHRDRASVAAKSGDHTIVSSVPVSNGGVFCKPETIEQQGGADREHHYRWWWKRDFD